MGLIRCAECKAKISDKATTCPKCGVPIEISQKKQKSRMGTGCGCLFAILAIVGIIIASDARKQGNATNTSAPNGAGPAQTTPTEQQRKEIFIKLQALGLKADKEAIGMNPLDASQGLSTGEVFQLTKETPLVPDIKQKDWKESLSEMKKIPSGYFIKMKSIETSGASTYFEVAVADQNRKYWGKGYIHQIALMGQRKAGSLSPQEILMQQQQIADRLFSQYEQELAKENNITTNDLFNISLEAVEKGWVGQ